MKKKGRICGTIGLVLSVAVASGAVLYSAMWDSRAAAKASKPFGSFIGKPIGNVEGNFEQMLTLTGEAAALTALAPEESATVKSYTLNFTYKAYADEEDGIVDIEADGTIVSDANYTYIKYASRELVAKGMETELGEYIFNKSSGVLYKNTATLSAPLMDTAWDTSISKNAVWEPSADFESLAVVLFSAYPAEIFAYADVLRLAEANIGLKSLPTGANRFTLTSEGTDGLSGECTYTVGMCPEIRFEGDKESYVYRYSLINATEVRVPAAVKGE